VVVCFDFAEVCADARIAAGFKGVRDGVERVAVDVVSVSGRVVQVSLYEAEGARTLCKEVGAAKLEAYIYAC
jgi:IMP dehydrogenase/GMP reductase